jgi:recombinational DNA repair ATPase RecF
MQLAQARLVPREAAATSLILLDDLGAELDSANQQRVFEELVRTDAQVFMTSIQAEPWYRNIPTDLSAMFHVERGTLTRMV